ncbi:MAG: transglycosylase SLT domain-containing protein [Betaproteobacteria bacterium]
MALIMNLTRLIYRHLVLISSLFLVFSCAHPNVPVSQNRNDIPPDISSAPKSVTVDEASASSLAAAPEAAESSPAEVGAPSQSDKNAPLSKKENGKENGGDEQSILDTALELTETAQEYWEDGDEEQAIESLDQAYALILKVPGNNPKLSQQKEDLRFVISKRIMEMYASRQTTVSGTSAAIPMTINDHVQREIQSFQTLERDFFVESYKRSGRYRGEMVKALREAGMPEELSWLPLIESGFKVRALSRSRALGLWQFIPSTGYKYGLKRNAWIDERLDPAKATAAAIAYLTELHQMFGDWATVLAAYNCGEGSVARVIRGQKIDYLDNFWDFYERLPRETARYFPRFLAVLTILKDPARYGFTLDEIDTPLSYETVTIEKPVHLSSVAENLEVDLEELTALNPELRRDATPNSPYALKVPVGKGEAVLASIEQMARWTPPKVEYVVHRVRRGETLYMIALRYRTSMQRIREANNLRSGRMLRIGQRLKIPTRSAT